MCCASLAQFSFICVAWLLLLLILIIHLITLTILRLANIPSIAQFNKTTHEFVQIVYDLVAKDEPIKLDNVRIGVSIGKLHVSYDQSEKFLPNDLLLFYEKMIADGQLLQLIGSDVINKAYWFFSERNARTVVWVTFFFELPVDVKSAAEFNEVLLKFNRKRVTVKASILDTWCQSWDALHQQAKSTAFDCSNDSD